MFRSSVGVIGAYDQCPASLTRFCDAKPCQHGVCREKPTDYYCDCSNTLYTGHTCERPAPVATFDCVNSYQATMTSRRASHTDDITVRFRTLKGDGLLFKTHYDYTDDSIEMSLRQGRGRLEVNLGNQVKVRERRPRINFKNIKKYFFVSR